MKFTLKDYQEDAVEDVLDSLASATHSPSDVITGSPTNSIRTRTKRFSLSRSSTLYLCKPVEERAEQPMRLAVLSAKHRLRQFVDRRAILKREAEHDRRIALVDVEEFLLAVDGMGERLAYLPVRIEAGRRGERPRPRIRIAMNEVEGLRAPAFWKLLAAHLAYLGCGRKIAVSRSLSVFGP